MEAFEGVKSSLFPGEMSPKEVELHSYYIPSQALALSFSILYLLTSSVVGVTPPPPTPTFGPSSQPTAQPSQLAQPQTISAICPSHNFATTVKVECITSPLAPNDVGYIRVQVRNSVNYVLSYDSIDPLSTISSENQASGHGPGSFTSFSDYESTFYVDIMPKPLPAPETILVQDPTSEFYANKLLGIALDGVPIYSATLSQGVDALNPLPESGQAPLLVDQCGGSYGMTPDGMRYHYRAFPTCILDTLKGIANADKRKVWVDDIFSLLDAYSGSDSGISIIPFTPPTVIGYSLTGFPIYSPFDENGLLHTGLDNCNGKYDSQGNYGYYATPTFPYLIGCDGPGVYNAQEHKVSLESMPSKLSHISLNACPRGQYPSIDFRSNGCVKCEAGKYSTATYAREDAGVRLTKEFVCNMDCPVGHYCPAGSVKPLKCPAGRFGATRNLGTIDCDGECYEGYYCPPGSTSPNRFVCGNATYYCPAGTPIKLNVEPTFFSVPEDVPESRRTAQQECGPGYYCPGTGKRLPCPPGRYGETTNLGSSNCTDICPKGYYCETASIHPVPCPAGRYGQDDGMVNSDCSGLCNAGYWCPAASTSPTQVPCLPGRYGAEMGLTSIECNNGADGSGCELGGSPNITSSADTKFCVERPCSAGYYCPEASTSPTQVQCGIPPPEASSDAQKPRVKVLPLQEQNVTININKTVTVTLNNYIATVLSPIIPLYGANVYCPPASSFPTPSLPGYYTIGPASSPGDPQQSQLDVNIRTAQVPCEPGYYCINGIKLPCSPGTYGGTYRLSTSACSGLCSPGYICLTASSVSIQYPCGVDASVYCPAGSYEPIPVPPGYYSVGGTSITTRSAIVICEAGYYCNEGVKYPCPAGRFAALPGRSTADCDGLCTAGYYCQFASSSPTQYICPPGRYGAPGMTNAYCKGSCISGYYCPAGSTLPYQNECGADSVYCPHGSGAPLIVSAGYYSVGQNETIRTDQNVCTQFGSYYGTPPAADTRENVCPSNTV